MTILGNLEVMERTREAYWGRYPHTSPVRLRWRAVAVRHTFHVLPGESILEIGAGSGLWTHHLTTVLRGENPITMAVFNRGLAKMAQARALPATTVLDVEDMESLRNAGPFDYIIGTAILCHNRYTEQLDLLHSLLKPGGKILFFEANYWNPQVWLKTTIPAIGRWTGNAPCQISFRRSRICRAAARAGFESIEAIPYDIVHGRTPAQFLRTVRTVGYLIEHLPGIKQLCGTLFIYGARSRNGEKPRQLVDLATHQTLHDSVSVVVPCHNEETTVRSLVATLSDLYGAYIHEIVLVDDCSSDGTAAVAHEIASNDPRVRVIRRVPPPGVGRALREGYAAATGRYILTIDCDFAALGPELRDMFDVVASGQAGSIGSRFSQDSVLIGYPALKMMANRTFHLLVRLVLKQNVRDVTNNLKLLPADILKSIEILENGFAANAETGLKPLLAGCRIQEVPMSWIGRTAGMGASSFRVLDVSPGYARVFVRLILDRWRTLPRA